MTKEIIKQSDSKVPRSWPGRSMHDGANNIIFAQAKKIRNSVTIEKMILWGMLKGRFPILKFRRQHPGSNYIADLHCHLQNS
ncbi:hypothetical protein BH11BAC4_BH11BAC4_17150 [soil metagenome]